MKTCHDPLTLDLFEVPVPREPVPGALDVGLALRHLISDLLKPRRTGVSRSPPG